MRDGKALETGRNLMQRQRTFTPKDTPVLVAAGLAEGFDAVHNTVDAQIDRFLDGHLGHPWRDHINPQASQYTADEQRALEAAAAEVAAAQLVYDRALAEVFVSEDYYRHPLETSSLEALREIGRRHDVAVRGLIEARTALERVTPKVTEVQLRADRRRRAAAMARIGE